MKRNILYFMLIMLTCSCADKSIEEKFYLLPPNIWPEKFEDYNINQKWKIFLYGMNHAEPPPAILALGIAKEKSRAIPEMVSIIKHDRDKMEKMGIVSVIMAMKENYNFDPCSDSKFDSAEVQEIIASDVEFRAIRACAKFEAP